MFLLETIKIVNYTPKNLIYHQQRVNKTFKKLFPSHKPINLKHIINAINIPTKNTYKLRIIYDNKTYKTELIKYIPRKIKTLKIVHDNQISYNYKFYDRTQLNKLLQLRETCDDILIVKNGLITDTSFSNIVFYDGKNWFTPATPLLQGTQRQKLLDKGTIIPRKIKITELNNFTHFALINALIEFDYINPIKNIKN